MAKVIFEFDEVEEREDINLIVNRYKLQSALDEIASLRSALINDKIYNESVLYRKDDTQYIDIDYIERRLGNALDNIYPYINY